MVEYLYQVLEEQQGQIQLLSKSITLLRREAITCREDVAALNGCLVDSGHLRPTAFQAQVHRRRFAAVREAHCFVPELGLDDILHLGKVSLLLGLYAGPMTLRSVDAVCRAGTAGARSAWPKVRDLCPDYIYVFGGSPDNGRSSHSVERWKPGSDSWEPLPQMNERRAYASAGIIGGKLFVCGGSSNGLDGPLLRSVECFNPEKHRWESMPSMLVARRGASSAVVDGALCICGGVDGRGQESKSAERLALGAGQWEVLPSMLERRGGPAVGKLRGRLYVCGGSGGGQLPSSTVECLEPGSGVWRIAPSMTERRVSAMAATVQGSLFVCGGISGRQVLLCAECLRPGADAWEAIPWLLMERSCGAMAAVAGRLYFFGGVGKGQSLNTAEAFELATCSWTSLPTMSEKRAGVAVGAALC